MGGRRRVAAAENGWGKRRVNFSLKRVRWDFNRANSPDVLTNFTANLRTPRRSKCIGTRTGHAKPPRNTSVLGSELAPASSEYLHFQEFWRDFRCCTNPYGENAESALHLAIVDHRPLQWAPSAPADFIPGLGLS
ncbi:hypothetical protein K443DRAFT_679574 [Laccaria amethystina LaAM-08-1]|uniref:Uncharacterized protein n=1 Tax=Laccaria amethystina LaAM-08-1 TaxID=1095629 RepID=A0A0C9XQP2_9AGAR|nr:hypothetical protein K443DRAFT_679574 [Laccaria amethystina LaAM-08-1]